MKAWKPIIRKSTVKDIFSDIIKDPPTYGTFKPETIKQYIKEKLSINCKNGKEGR